MVIVGAGWLVRRGVITQVQIDGLSTATVHVLLPCVIFSTVIEALECTSHVVSADFTSDQQAQVAISPNDSIPNKDFVLRYKVAGQTVKSALVTHRDQRGGFFTLMLYPPGLAFVSAFFGCLCARVIGVPVHPPRPRRDMASLRAALLGEI